MPTRSKTPIRASSPAAVVSRHAVVVGRRDEVRADQPVRRPAADPEGADQDPEGARARALAQRAHGEPVAGPTCDPVCRVAGSSSGSPGCAPRGRRPRSAGRSRTTSSTSGTSSRAAPVTTSAAPAPARPGRERGDPRQEDQLSGGAGGREDPGDQAAARLHEPPVGDDGAEHEGHRPGADARRTPPRAATAATARSSRWSARCRAPRGRGRGRPPGAGRTAPSARPRTARSARRSPGWR